MVELCYGQVFHKAPTITAIPGDIQAAIVAFNDVAGAVWVQPNGVVVRVDFGVGCGNSPCFTSIGAFGNERPKGVKGLVVEGIHKEVRIVEGAVADVLVFADFEPLESTIVGAVQAILGLVFNERVDFFGVTRSNGNAHSAQFAFWKSIFGGPLGPGFASVQGHVHTAAFAAGFEDPGPTAVFPHGADQLIGINRIHDKVSRTGSLVVVEHFGPGLAAVGGFVHAAVWAIAPRHADGRHVDGVRISGVNDNAVDVLGLFQANQLEGFSAVYRFEKAAAAGL